MQSHEIRQRFLDFFAKRGHAILPSASLVPENDPSVLFNTAGMQPLVPYLMGQKHPLGNRLASCQKCVRTGDLDDIGDNRHFSFFEMLGNWSLGDYFKEEAIKWSYEFLTDKEHGLGLDPARLAVTIFKGDENAPYDQESKDIWLSLGIPEHRIYALPAGDNWWSPGDNGPCGPCSEMFYDMTGEFVGKEISHNDFLQLIEQEKFIEIWNDVFMEYEKREGKVIGKLAQKNVDTGAGLERLAAVMQGKHTAYNTDLFKDIFEYIKDNSKDAFDVIPARIIADHVRTATLMISDGVIPGNKDQGYVLRRLIRRALVQANKIQSGYSILMGLQSTFVSRYEKIYNNLKQNPVHQYEIFIKEIEKFQNTLHNGLKEFEKGIDPFILATTYGFPIELTEELAKERGINIDRVDFDKKMSEHQKLSQSASAGMFKGGLANTNEKTVQLHTAHHLLLSALQQVLGPEVKQRGSNITEERLRIDFVFDRKMTDEEKSEVEKIVNEKIQAKLPVVRKEMKREDAEQIGAQMEFGAKYPDTVSVYMIGGEDAHAFSKEFCGGPHVQNTSELGTFKIQKEEASSAGIRRIKAVLQ
ncbi:MAG: alanine--tRNA ligase [Candidatus Pacebacteria bacterium]|nr:alanine--tRNA ligase [Candidatus Paceibacterota bacterium]